MNKIYYIRVLHIGLYIGLIYLFMMIQTSIWPLSVSSQFIPQLWLLSTIYFATHKSLLQNIIMMIFTTLIFSPFTFMFASKFFLIQGCVYLITQFLSPLSLNQTKGLILFCTLAVLFLPFIDFVLSIFIHPQLSTPYSLIYWGLTVLCSALFYTVLTPVYSKIDFVFEKWLGNRNKK